jgi:hypothetical protein
LRTPILGIARDALIQRIIRTIILATLPVVNVGRRIKLIDPMIKTVASTTLASPDGIVIATIATITFVLAGNRAATGDWYWWGTACV